MFEYASSADRNNIGVIIAGAGGSAHLPGMISALTSIPVLGVPIESKKLKGIKCGEEKDIFRTLQELITFQSRLLCLDGNIQIRITSNFYY